MAEQGGGLVAESVLDLREPSARLGRAGATRRPFLVQFHNGHLRLECQFIKGLHIIPAAAFGPRLEGFSVRASVAVGL